MAALTLSLGGCADTQSLTNNIPGMHSAPSSQAPAESFSYRPAADRDINVSIDKVVTAGSPDFLPGDPSWLQLEMRIANVGSHTIKITDVREKLSDGTAVAGPTHTSELLKQPNMAKSTMTTIGVGAASMVAGMFFMPLALIGGAAIALSPSMSADGMEKKLDAINHAAMQNATLAAGTSEKGDVFLPAVAGQTGVIVFYEVDGATRTLTVERAKADH
jgi:hypothetical protein